jgi:hypothetical protein
MIHIKLIILFLLNALIVFGQDIDELEKLIEYLKKEDSNKKIGFLSGSNVQSVKRLLPPGVKTLIIPNKLDLIEMIMNGTITAGLTSGIPDLKYHDKLHIFSSSIVTMHSVLMAPDYSTDTPHGTTDDFSTYDLSMAINAAIARLQNKGTDLKLAEKNAPKEIVLAHTCKDDFAQFPIANRSSARGLLKNILQNRKIKILADGPYNWGDNDGNYLVNPPTGFYPDLLDAIFQEFQNLSGPDNQTYGLIQVERVYTNQSTFPWYYLFDGTTHMTEPYYILDAVYYGSGKPCSTSADCFNANLPSGKESCDGSKCRHPARPRYGMLRASCTTLGSDSKFFTKRTNSGNNNDNDKTNLSGGAIAGFVVLSLLVLGLIFAVSFLIFNEKRGRPLFLDYRST